MHFDWPFFWRYLFEPSATYLDGLALTVVLSIVSQTLGTILGLFIALARIAQVKPLQGFARFYVWLMRGTPLLVQIVFIYTGLAAADIVRFHDISLGFLTVPGNVQAGILALSLNEGAYMAEIIRAGIAAVDRGQTEAAKSVGMTYPLLMRRIVLPQAARFILPPLGNEFNAMLKNSTLVSVIGVQELLLTTETLTSATFRVFELYAIVALYFLTLTTLWGLAQNRIEAHFGNSAQSLGPMPGARRRLLGMRPWREARPAP